MEQLLTLTLFVTLDLRYTAIWNSAALQSDDFSSAISAAMSKKKPTFEKL
jgi:delta(3,5)-delta(2,4)-dienoyl-CoA isomerase